MLKSFRLGILVVSVTAFGAVSSAIASAQQPQQQLQPQQRQPSQQPTVTPAPEAQFNPSARVTLTSDRVNVLLTNNTNAAISYQAIGDTQVRTLPGRGTVTLRGLRVPTTLTLRRQDFGLLRVMPKQSEQSPGTIEVTLDATTNFATDGITMQVDRNGSVFFY